MTPVKHQPATPLPSMTEYQLDITALRLAKEPEHQAAELASLASELNSSQMRYLLGSIAREERALGE